MFAEDAGGYGMTEIAMDAEAPSGESTAPALRDVAEAGRWAAAAKRTHSADTDRACRTRTADSGG